MVKSRIVFFFILAFTLIGSSAAQRTVKVRISFKKECHNPPELYFVFFKINDSITFEKFTDTTFVVFNVPKFLIRDSLCKAWVEEVSFKQYRGSICETGLGCSVVYGEELVNSKQLKQKNELDISITSLSGLGCGSLPGINFQYNSSNIEDAYIEYNSLPIGRLYNTMELYCFMDLCFQYPNMDIVIHGGTGFYEEGKDSLGFERAMAVKKLLIEFGINAEQVFIENDGDKRAKESVSSYPKGKKNQQLSDEIYCRVWFQLRRSKGK